MQLSATKLRALSGALLDERLEFAAAMQELKHLPKRVRQAVVVRS